MVRRLMLVLVALLSFGAALARADGLPVVGIVGSAHGVATPNGRVRYTTRPRGRDTLVRALAGRSIRTARLPGRYVVPVVAYDGSASGLSANGRTLVLVRPRTSFPRRLTPLAILDTRTLRVRAYGALRGDFSVDAISPNGRWVYLIQYTSAANPTDYRVRALDTSTMRLLGRTIVDPHDRGEAMRGYPITRVSSPDGRWAYTLYDGNGHPFVHALDTAALSARCIDVPAFPPNTNPYTAQLTLTPDRLLVEQSPRVLASIDTVTLKLLPVARGVRPPARSAVSAERSSGGAFGTASAIIAAFVLLGAATLLLRRKLVPASRAADAP